MDLNDLRRKRAKLMAENRAIVETAEAADRDFTGDEQAQFDLNIEQAASLQTRIERLEQLEAEPAPQATRIPQAPGPEARREFENLGEFVHAVAFNRDRDQRLSNLYFAPNAAGERIAAEQRMDEGEAGGFMIPSQFRQELLQVDPQGSVVRSRARVIPAGSPPDAPLTFPALDQDGATPDNMYGGVTVDWIGEGQDKPPSNASMREITLTPQEVAGRLRVTEKFLRNWQAASSVLSGLMGGALEAAQDRAFWTGDGVAKPLGVLNGSSVIAVNRASANEIKIADIHKMLAKAKMGGNLVWVYSQSILGQLMQLQDNSGSAAGLGKFIWGDAVGGNPATLKGRPAIQNDRSPVLGSKGDLALVDMSYYLIKDGSGPYIDIGYDDGDFRSNRRTLRICTLVDGQSWLRSPIKLENGYTVSPFVSLDVPAA